MIKVDSTKDTGIIKMKGTDNTILNELRYLVRYSVSALGPIALEAISDGLQELEEDLINKKDKEVKDGT